MFSSWGWIITAPAHLLPRAFLRGSYISPFAVGCAHERDAAPASPVCHPTVLQSPVRCSRQPQVRSLDCDQMAVLGLEQGHSGGPRSCPELVCGWDAACPHSSVSEPGSRLVAGSWVRW